MTTWLFLIATLAVVSSRPQYNSQDTSVVEFVTYPNGQHLPRLHQSTQFSRTDPYTYPPQPPNPLNKLKNNTNSSANLVVVSPLQQIKASKVTFGHNIKNHKFLEPYKSHPLFHYIKNRNTIKTDKIISFRNNNLTTNVTTLILKPVAKAVAGIGGKAVSMPLSRAVLRQGANVDILFEPEAVAIAGPGGVAHAQSELEISYEEII